MTLTNPVNSLEVAKRIADPVHGLIRITEMESQVMQHSSFQRLRDITQLGMTKYVFPGSTHNRFSHSLGVLQNVTAIFDVAFRNYIRSPELCGDIQEDLLFSEHTLKATRLAALCHDLGHFPLSHNLEQAIDWLHKKKIIDKNFKHEDLSTRIVEELLGPIIGEFVPLVNDLIISNYPKLQNCLFPAYVISSAIDADRMDYLMRDSLYCGVDQGRFDKSRLLDSIIPYNTKVNNQSFDVLGFKSKGIEAIEQFLLARHRMHQTIYFNPSVVGFEASMRRAYYMISTNNPPWELPDVYFDEPLKFLDFTEHEFLTDLKRELRKRNSWLEKPLIERTPLRKFGPFYYTTEENDTKTIQEHEIYQMLQKCKTDLENPIENWYQDDHWVFVEKKSQRLVDTLEIDTNSKSSKPELTLSLKNSFLLVNATGDLVDPTTQSFGHTFLPLITGHTYHRFLFFSEKKNGEKLKNELSPIMKALKETQKNF